MGKSIPIIRPYVSTCGSILFLIVIINVKGNQVSHFICGEGRKQIHEYEIKNYQRKLIQSN